MSPGAALFMTVLVLLGYAVGMLVLVAGARQIREAWAARSWPTMPAVLQKCEVATRSASNSTVYYVALKYTYAVAGVAYGGTTLAIGTYGSSNRASAEEAQRTVVAMRPLIIRYNPAQPDVSAVCLSDPSEMYGTFFGGLFALAIVTCVTLGVLFLSGGLHAIGQWFA